MRQAPVLIGSVPSVIDRRYERRRDHRSDAGKIGQSAARIVRAANRQELCIKLFEANIKIGDLDKQIVEEVTSQVRQLGGGDGAGA